MNFSDILNILDAYKAIEPTHCMFSDRETMEENGAKTLTFVQGRFVVFIKFIGF